MNLNIEYLLHKQIINKGELLNTSAVKVVTELEVGIAPK